MSADIESKVPTAVLIRSSTLAVTQGVHPTRSETYTSDLLDAETQIAEVINKKTWNDTALNIHDVEVKESTSNLAETTDPIPIESLPTLPANSPAAEPCPASGSEADLRAQAPGADDVAGLNVVANNMEAAEPRNPMVNKN